MVNKKWLFIVGGVLLLAGATYYGPARWFVVQSIEVELQNQELWEGSAEVVKVVLKEKLNKWIGRPIWQVSFKDLQQVVLSEPRAGEVKILRKLPNRFFIQIQARRPLLVLLNSETGDIHSLSMQGKVLPPLSPSQVPDLPILRGDVFFKDKNIRKKAIHFMNLLPEQGEFSRQTISEIKYADKSLIFILSTNGKPVKIGGLAPSVQLKRVASVLRYLDQKNIQWELIDARFSQKIVVSATKPQSP